MHHEKQFGIMHLSKVAIICYIYYQVNPSKYIYMLIKAYPKKNIHKIFIIADIFLHVPLAHPVGGNTAKPLHLHSFVYSSKYIVELWSFVQNLNEKGEKIYIGNKIFLSSERVPHSHHCPAPTFENGTEQSDYRKVSIQESLVFRDAPAPTKEIKEVGAEERAITHSS
ncbi:hypothetical protein CEXT_542701 [Caerostris extrusa]|uniref:Uncharacterized protein n=1 Tax=Caerostris extrusa TaxID=172846 RepID=A0AAV4PSD5_CAEEX|nr:hypothetical protein CEXT_542701 [Caerostris extrusa]